MFASLLSSIKFQDKPTKSKDEDNNKEKGYYFIDRDGTLFRHILNFLRTTKLHLPREFDETEQLTSEAQFYGLDNMVQALQVTNVVAFNVLQSS